MRTDPGAQVPQLPSERWRRLLAVGWMLWGTVTLIFAGLVTFMSLIPINCTPPALHGSPGGEAYMSLWPFGPGCKLFEWNAPPAWGWTASLGVLAVAGSSLAVSQRRYNTAFMQRSATPAGR